MEKFIVLYLADATVMDQMTEMTPQERQASMEEWMIWAQKCGSALVDMGLPVGEGKTVKPDETVKSQSKVTGYSILQANGIDEATKLMDKHPHLAMQGGAIEVLSLIPMPGQ